MSLLSKIMSRDRTYFSENKSTGLNNTTAPGARGLCRGLVYFFSFESAPLNGTLNPVGRRAAARRILWWVREDEKIDKGKERREETKKTKRG